MKKLLRAAAFLSLVAALAAPVLFGQNAPRYRVGYVPFVNASGETRYDIVSRTATDTLELELGMVPHFEVERITDIDPYKRYDKLKDYAKKRSLDFVVFGKTGTGRGGEIVLQLSVFDRSRGGLAITRDETAGTALDVFGAAERLVVSVVKDFSGIRIGLGAVEFANTGEDGDYEVYADGELLGKNFLSSRKIFIGNRLFEVRQNRMLGLELIRSARVSIEEGKETRVEFAIPYLTEKERARIGELEGRIEDLENDRGAKERVRGIYSELIALFRDVSFCRRLAEERERYRQMEAEYALKTLAWEIEDTFFKPEERTFDAVKSIYDGRGSYLDPVRIETLVSDTSQYLFEVLRLHALHEFSRGDWDRGISLYRFMERIEKSVPLRTTGTFEEDRRFVYKMHKKYTNKSEEREVFTEIMMGVNVGKRFDEDIKSAERFFEHAPGGGPNELIVLTSPGAMSVSIDGKVFGSSPLRVWGLESREVEVAAKNKGSRDTAMSQTVVLAVPRTFVFLKSGSGIERIAVNRVEAQKKGTLKLSWSPVPGAKHYRVQVDTADGDFVKPIADLKRVEKPYAVLGKRLKKGTQYVYRVQAVREKEGAGFWGYSDPFSAE